MRWSPWLLSSAARGRAAADRRARRRAARPRCRAATSSWCKRPDAVALLHRELGRVADLGDAVGERGRDRERGHFVLHVRDLVARDRRRRERRRRARRGRRPARRTRSPVGTTSMSAPMRRSTSTKPSRVGLSETSSITISEPGVIDAATTKNAADDGSPGTSRSNGSTARRARRATVRPSTVDRRAERGEHALGVVARRRGRHDLGRAVGLQPGEEQRRLHLRATRPASSWRMPAQRAAADRRAARASPSSRPSTCAPIARSGSTTRAIGRSRSDASPVSTVRNGRPASTPGEHRASSCPSCRSRSRRRLRASPSNPVP